MSYAILNGMQKIRLSGSEKRSFARWGHLYAKSARLQYNPPMFLKLNGVITTAISMIGTVVLYYLAVKTGVGESQYYAVTAAYGRVMGAFIALAGIAISVASIKPVLEMAEPILKAEPEVAAEKQPIDRVSGRIEMRHVTFRYDENTRVVIAHRLSTIRNCDRILVMDRGAIIEEGTYEALIEKDGYFAELVTRQRLDMAG